MSAQGGKEVARDRLGQSSHRGSAWLRDVLERGRAALGEARETRSAEPAPANARSDACQRSLGLHHTPPSSYTPAPSSRRLPARLLYPASFFRQSRTEAVWRPRARRRRAALGQPRLPPPQSQSRKPSRRRLAKRPPRLLQLKAQLSLRLRLSCLSLAPRPGRAWRTVWSRRWSRRRRRRPPHSTTI